MDFDSSTKFISSLAKFLQSLCNGYVEFDNGVEVIGHIYLSVDTGKKIDYILNEKVCKTDENSVTFISNSFHAQPAEKPKAPAPKSIKANSEKEQEKTADDDDIILMDEPESTNTGTVPTRDNSHAHNNVPQSNVSNSPGASKRPYNQHYSSNRPSKHRKIESSISNPNGAHRNSHEPSDSTFIPSDISNVTAASESDLSHLSQVLRDNNSSSVEERDVKPVLDSDMNVVNVKQEYDPSAEAQDSKYNEPQNEDDYYSNMSSHDQSYDMGGSQYYEGRRGMLQSEYGEMASGDMYQGGAGPGEPGGAMMGDPQGQGANGSVESLSRLYNASRAIWRSGQGCPVAGCNARSFRFAAHLVVHWKEKHEPMVRKYSCPHCPVAVKRRAYLVKHCRLKHYVSHDTATIPHFYEQNNEFHDPDPITIAAVLGLSQDHVVDYV